MKNLFVTIAIVLLAGFAANAQSDVHKVDFKNFTYTPYCAGEDTQKVTVKNGEFSSEKKVDDFVEHFYFNIFSVTYGDLNGDKQDEAVVLSVCNTGGTGNFSEGFVYSMKGGKPSLIARIAGGDRADGGLVSATVVDGMLNLEANESSSNSGACCPEFTVTDKLKLSAGKFVSVGEGVRKELYPRERVTFARGATSKTFTVTIPANDKKRYIIGAGAGQTMTVSVNNADANISILEDVESTEGKNSLTAKLPKKGDYTIEIGNVAQAEAAIDVVVKITIK